MSEQTPPSPSDDSRLTKALPYVVGLLFAGGLFAFNLRDDGGRAGGDQPATDATAVEQASESRAIVTRVRSSLDGEEFADVDIAGRDGRIVLTGLVADEADLLAAGERAAAVDGVVAVDNRLRILPSPGPASDDSTVTSGPELAAADTTAAATVAPTTAAPPTSAATPPTSAATTVAPTTVAPPTTAASAPTTVAPTAAPVVVPSAEELDAALASLLQASPVQFDLLATRVALESQPVLDQAAAIMLSSPTARFEVAGHTDSGGQPSFNLRLSQQRADAVRDYLVLVGVPADRVAAVGYGEDFPVARNATPEGRALNRRVEIVVTG